MTQNIKIPGRQSKPKYIEGIRVTYKATSGIFNYYDWRAYDVDEINGVIIGWGFQFDTTKGKPNKKKSVSLVSSEFGFEIMTNDTPIKMRELLRENGEHSSSLIWAKSYKDWKADGQRLTKIIYVLDANDISKIYKIQFSGLSFGEVNKMLTDDMPQYICNFKASTETKSTENGDFYMPIITKMGETPESLWDTIADKVNFVYGILNQTTEKGCEIINDEPVDEVTAEMVFGVDDIP